MHIVIEGADATGKSTLAEQIKFLTGYPIIGSAGPPESSEEMIDRVNHYLRLLTPHIFDRHPCVSDPIYGKFRGGSPILFRQIYEFYDQGNFFIFTPYIGGLKHQPQEVDTDEHLDLIEKNHTKIVKEYARWGFEHAHAIYRYTETDKWRTFIGHLREQI